MGVLSLTYEDVLLGTQEFMVQHPSQITDKIATYRGVVTEFPYEITIKIYLMESFGRQRLRTELRAMKFCRHRNIIRYIGGRSMKGGEFMGIYESVSYTTLQGLLYADPSAGISWDGRVNIALDVAKGLSYLHDELDDRIHVIHCNLSPSAIFFSGPTAKIGRFELSKLVKDGTGVSTNLVPLGKLGYMPPEIMTSKVFTKAGDVYSFGVIILELITRRHPHKPGWSSESLRSSFGSDQDLSQILDPTLLSELDLIRESVYAVLVKVGLQCTEPNPSNRPTMAEVVVMLERIIFKYGSPRGAVRNSPGSYANQRPDRMSRMLRGSKEETESSFFANLDNLEVRLLFDTLEGKSDNQRRHRRGILPSIRKRWKKFSSRFRRKKKFVKLVRTDPESENVVTDLDVIEKEQEYLASVIIANRP
ncbi:hypothetical protein R1sor_000415 [Riccia sorocarpa]|uniref:Protein kinase domain-containing protein n=1 Tax=Riccia sorocarpa TaxID=122646 RepID=A0ABD3GTA8_9MARC